MKINMILTLLLLILTMGIVNQANASKVRQLTFSGGMGHSSSGTQRMKVIMGQPLMGRTTNTISGHGAKFGFWNIWYQTSDLSPVVGDTPDITTRLFHNYPNPFNPSTQIQFSIDTEKHVRIDIYDLKGRKVDTVFEGVKGPGVHKFTYQPVSLASGSYMILMRSDSFRATQRMTLIK